MSGDLDRDHVPGTRELEAHLMGPKLAVLDLLQLDAAGCDLWMLPAQVICEGAYGVFDPGREIEKATIDFDSHHGVVPCSIRATSLTVPAASRAGKQKRAPHQPAARAPSSPI
jgi:hypothetical protein